MSNIIDIKEFKGCFTNGDLEDLDIGVLTESKNMRIRNGQLIKTYGIGITIETGSSSLTDLNNIITFINEHLTDPEGYRYFKIKVNSSTKVVSIEYYDTDILNWETLTLSGTFYHKNARNPIVTVGEILRILPGNVGKADGSNESKGIWYGYIDRDFFDELYSPSGIFYNYPTEIVKPDLTITQLNHSMDGGFSNEEGNKRRYYRFSYIYDGIQESLLSDSYTALFSEDENEFLELQFNITKASHNKRITALKVYRSDFEESTELYKNIHTIDFLRKSGEIHQSTEENCYNGQYTVHIIGCNYTNWDAHTNYYIKLWRKNALGVANLVMGLKIVKPTAGYAYNNFTISKWDIINGVYNLDPPVVMRSAFDADWDLYGDSSHIASSGKGGGGGFAGIYTAIISEDTGTGILAGSIFIFDPDDTKEIRTIESNFEKVIRFSGNSIGSSANAKKWLYLKASDGLYYYNDGTSVTVHYFDHPGMTVEKEYHPLATEKSIKVNGEFARVINGRLWQGNIVLDPGDTNESHQDWASYSELSQYDVNPVSNVLKLTDREGGAITGIAEVFGNVVLLKKQAVITVNTKQNTEPVNWYIQESSHNIGNIAKQGYITAMDSLYICHYDGIYRLTPNNLAESDMTPTEQLRVSEPINDVYQSMTTSQKEDIQSCFDPLNSEIIFKFPFVTVQIWAFNIMTGDWRQIDTDVNVTLMTPDEEARVLVYNTTDEKLYTLGNKEAVGFSIKTKTFPISDDRFEVIRKASITYKSTTALTLSLYAENDSTPVATYTLPAHTVSEDEKFAIRYRVKKFAIKILDSTKTQTETIINRLQIETD